MKRATILVVAGFLAMSSPAIAKPTEKPSIRCIREHIDAIRGEHGSRQWQKSIQRIVRKCR